MVLHTQTCCPPRTQSTPQLNTHNWDKMLLGCYWSARAPLACTESAQLVPFPRIYQLKGMIKTKRPKKALP